MRQAVAQKANGTKDDTKLRQNVTETLADAVAKAIARKIIDAIAKD